MFRTLQINDKFSMRTCDIGDTVYMPVYNGIVIPCRVVGKEVIYESEDGASSIWGYFRDGEKPQWVKPSEELGEGGWHKWKEVEQPTTKVVNEFLTVDEPVGHSVQLDDQVFETLKAAMDCLLPTSKKHLARRLKEYRHSTARWIASTWRSDNRYGKPRRRENKELLDAFKAGKTNLFPPKRVYAKKR